MSSPSSPLRRGLLRSAALLAFLSTAAIGQAPAATAPRPEPVFPGTALGRLGQSLIEALDAGDSTAVLRFAADHLGRDVRGRSTSGMRDMLVKLRAQSGGARVMRIMPAGRALRVIAEARRGSTWFGMELEAAANDSMRLGSLLVVPMQNPATRRPPQPWATGALSDEQIASVIRERVRAAADSDRFSGVVLVARGDRILVHDAHGYADREAGRRNTLATPFGVASVGKVFTGVAIAQLVADGRLRWDDTLASVLPGYPNREAARRLTIRQLLTHTAGVPEPFLAPAFDVARDHGSHERMLALFADAPLTANAGRAFEYSNGNYVALAAVVERLAGQRFDDYLRQRVWGPSGMQMPRGPRAMGYARYSELDPLGLEPRRPETVRGRRECPRVLGFGCGAYSAEDLFRFGRALRTHRLLPAAVTDSVIAGRVALGGATKYAYGFYEHTMSGARLIGHSGSNPDTGHDADFQLLWDHDWTVVVLSNYDAPAAVRIGGAALELIAEQMASRKQGTP